MPETTPVDQEAIAGRLRAVRERIEAACRRAGRVPEEVTLIGVTKTFSPEAVAAAHSAGLAHFGENRVQELLEKTEGMPGRVQGGGVCWHMVGHLQRNKAKDVVAVADVFHALDSPRLARELEKRAEQAGERVLPCFVQVNVSGEESKFGLDPEKVHPFLDGLASFRHLRVEGLMTIAAPVEDPEEVRPQFRLLRTLMEGYPSDGNPQVALQSLSMGMSSDFEVAIEEGATHVRIGSAIFGARESGAGW